MYDLHMGLVSTVIAAILSAFAILNFDFNHSFQSNEFNFVAPPKELKYFTLGYDESFSDSLWLRVVQDLHVCEKVQGGDPHTKEAKALRPEGVAACRRGWVFSMLDLITDVTPRFKMPYMMGATTLSVLVDDREGAAIIFDKGVAQFPNDWEIAYRAGYHYSIEMDNPVRAAQLLLQAGKNGAPEWVVPLAGRLYTKAGKAEIALSVLENALQSDPDGPGAARIRQRIDEIKRGLIE